MSYEDDIGRQGSDAARLFPHPPAQDDDRRIPSARLPWGVHNTILTSLRFTSADNISRSAINVVVVREWG